MLGRFGLGAPTVRAWTVTIREEGAFECVVLDAVKTAEFSRVLALVNNIRQLIKNKRMVLKTTQRLFT